MKDFVIENRPDGTVNCFSPTKLFKRREENSSYVWEKISMDDPTGPPRSVSDETAAKLEHIFETQNPVKIRRFPRDIPPKGTRYHEYKSGNTEIRYRGKTYKGWTLDRYDSFEHKTISRHVFQELPDWESDSDPKPVSSELQERLRSIRRYYRAKKLEAAEKANLKQDDVESDGNHNDSTAVVKRSKHGVVIPSNDGIHSFGIGVWKSTKYEGRTTICLFVAGRRFLYTVDKEHMAALRNEVARGEPT
jgi:hypothetical protein